MMDARPSTEGCASGNEDLPMYESVLESVPQSNTKASLSGFDVVRPYMEAIE